MPYFSLYILLVAYIIEIEFETEKFSPPLDSGNQDRRSCYFVLFSVYNVFPRVLQIITILLLVHCYW